METSIRPRLLRELCLSIALCAVASTVWALDGQPAVHDPSTVIQFEGRFYTYGTGRGLPMLVSDDGWTWRHAGSLMSAVPGGKPGPQVLARGGNNTWAPDIIHVGGKFFLYYAAPGRQPKAAVGLLVGRSLDPQSADFKWTDSGPVVWSDGIEDSNAIDPGVFLDPGDGRLWLTYGSYFGYIRLVELDPKTGLRRYPGRSPTNIAINSEASVIIKHEGWYYLLVNHGSCCAGANSTYNIRVGRSRRITGPYRDNMGIGMLEGGGKLFAGARGRHIGPGHFGLLDLGDGVQKFSMHYEADLDRGGSSVLDIRPLLWRDGWPVAGDNFTAGTYAIESARTGTVLELAVQGMPVGGPPRRRPGGAPDAAAAAAIADQDAAQVAANWPTGPVDVRLGPAMLQAQQKWRISPVGDAGGYPGSPWFRITVAGTQRALAATAGGELTTVPEFTGAAEQLWRIDQLADGTYRIMPKVVPGSTPAAGAIGSRQQHADAGAVRSRQRSPALERRSPMIRRLVASGICVLAGCLALRGRAADDATAPRPPPASLRHPAGASGPVDAQGFIRRWLVLEPIGVNGQLGDNAVEAAVRTAALPDTPTTVPREGDVVDHNGPLRWHAVESKAYNINLYHFAWSLSKPTSNVLFWVVTTVNSPVELPDARLAICSNAASVWWLNGDRVIAIYGDRQSVIDDGVSRRLTLHRGRNVIRAAVINGGGATDFCARFLDGHDQPVLGLKVSLQAQ